MAATSQRIPNHRGRGKPGPHSGYRSGNKDHYSSHPPSQMHSLPGVYSNPDMSYALVALVGCIVDVQHKSGITYQGVLKAVSPCLSIALALAHDKSKEPSRANTETLMQLEFCDLISVSVLPDANPSLGTKDIFKTDAEISRSNGSGFNKSFQPFAFDNDDSAISSISEDSSGWTAEDMFETNKNKFNVESSYDEEMSSYTTKLDRSDTKGFREREERAEKLAREIEGSSSANLVDDMGTEEELFSAVVRQEVAPPPLKLTTSKPPGMPISKPPGIPISKPPGFASGTKPPSAKPPGLMYASKPPGLHVNHHPHGGGQSYSAVVNTPDIRQSAKAPSSEHLATSCSGGTASSQTSSKESRQVHSADMEVRGSWNSQDETSVLSPSDENSSDWPECDAGGSQESSSGRGERGVVPAERGVVTTTSREQAGTNSPPTETRTEVTEVRTETAEVTEVRTKVEETAEVTEVTSSSPVNTTQASEVSSSSTNTKTNTKKKVQGFKLNPNAKMFNPGTPEFVPSSQPESPVGQFTSSPALLDPSSSSYQSSFPPPAAAGGKKYPKQRSHTHNAEAPQFTTPDYTAAVAAASAGGYMYSATPQQVSQVVQYPASLPQYAAAPQFHNTTGFITPQQQAITTPQHMINAGQNYLGEMTPQQVFAGTQPYSMHVAPQIIQQTPHGQLMVSVSQPQLTGGGLVSTPTPMMLVQSGVSTQQAPVLPGGLYSQHVPVAAGIMPQQVAGQGAAHRFIQQ